MAGTGMLAVALILVVVLIVLPGKRARAEDVHPVEREPSSVLEEYLHMLDEECGPPSKEDVAAAKKLLDEPEAAASETVTL